MKVRTVNYKKRWLHFNIPFQFVGVEGFVTAIVDLFPHHLRRGHRKELFIALCSAVWFLIGLSMVTEVTIFFCENSCTTISNRFDP